MHPRILACLAGAALLSPDELAGQAWQIPAANSAQPAGATAPTTVARPVTNRPFERGEVFTELDFTNQEIATRSAAGILTLDAFVGKAAARAIPAGTALRPADVMEPQLVYRGSPVRVHVRIDGIDIASSGRALSDGQLGKPVRVFSNVSSRTLDAVVTGPGLVNLVGF